MGGQASPCPDHAARALQAERFRRFAGGGSCLPGALPLFPAADGTCVDKYRVVKTVEAVARALHLPVRSRDGANLFGGHVFRVSGARHLAALGMPADTIMLMARWRSAIVLRYIRESPLVAVTSEYKARASGRLAEAVVAKAAEEAASRRRCSAGAASSSGCGAMELRRVLERVSELACQQKTLEDSLESRFDAWAVARAVVCNRGTGVWHALKADIAGTAAAESRTRCGCATGRWDYLLARRLPEAIGWWLICERCLPRERELRRAGSADTSYPLDSHDD